MTKKTKSVAATIIGKDAYAPKAGKGGKTAKKTLTQLVKQAQEAKMDAENCAEISRKNREYAFRWREVACEQKVAAEHAARTAKWCAAIAAASAIIAIITAAI